MEAHELSVQSGIILAILVLLVLTIVRLGSFWGARHEESGEVRCARCNGVTAMIDEHFDALDSGDLSVIEQYECPVCEHRQLRLLNDVQCWDVLMNDRIRG